ncbi:Gti1/Pac2 family domain-containing protein [Trichoderma longibrachiatum]
MTTDQPQLVPTFHGFINDTTDALILFSACLDGIISHVPRRPHDRERQRLIISGSVFIYEEHASGIKRWTDGISWSPSRILDNFLIYRELQRPFPPGEKKRALKRKRNGHGVQKPTSNSSGATADIERSLVGSLTDSYDFKGDGLVKKTISINYRGVPHHLNFRTPVPGMPLILHQHLQDPNGHSAAAAAAAAGHHLYLPVSAAADITPPAPTITPEQQVAFTQAMPEMPVTVPDSSYTTAAWGPALLMTADGSAHAEGQGHDHHQQYQMQQHAEVQHHHGHNYPQLQQQQLQQQQLQQQQLQQQQLQQQQLQQQQLPLYQQHTPHARLLAMQQHNQLNQHHHDLQPSPVQHQPQLPSPVQQQQQHPGSMQHPHQHDSAMQYQHAQAQQPHQAQQPPHLFQPQPQQRHHRHRGALQPAALYSHDHGALSLGENQQIASLATRFDGSPEDWDTWFTPPL